MGLWGLGFRVASRTSRNVGHNAAILELYRGSALNPPLTTSTTWGFPEIGVIVGLTISYTEYPTF